MKAILIPTDFSACATDATNAGMKLAERFNAKVHFYSRIDLPWNWKTLTEEERKENPEALQNIHIAEVLMKDIKKQYPNVEVETAYSGGSLVENIVDYVNMHNIDFIVMGSHGSSGKNEFFIGSNTQRVIRMVHCPVLVIKEKLENVDFRKVVYASSFNRNDKAAFLKFKDFVKHFIPEIHLVAVQTSSLLDPPLIVQKEAMEDYKKLAAPFDCHIHILRDFSIDKGVRFYSEEIDADLVSISNHYRHPLKRIFVGSNVEALVNHSDLPVLSIDYIEKDMEGKPDGKNKKEREVMM